MILYQIYFQERRQHFQLVKLPGIYKVYYSFKPNKTRMVVNCSAEIHSIFALNYLQVYLQELSLRKIP